MGTPAVNPSDATIAVLGERIIDLVPGEQAGSFHAHPGGSPANVALTLARLGVRPLLLGRRGQDAFAAVLDAHLRESGLPLTGLIDAEGVSMLAVCTRGDDGSMAYSFYTSDSPDLRWTEEDIRWAVGMIEQENACAWHTGSLASWLGSGVDVLWQAWRAARDADRWTLSYDPNARPHALAAEATRAWVERFALGSHVVKASDEDLAYCYPHTTPDEVCARWVDAGPAIVVLTRGAAGATVWQRGSDAIDVPGYPVDVVDTVGAGDTLTGALLAGLSPWCGAESQVRLERIDTDDLVRIVSDAVAAAAVTCSRAGANPPTAVERSEFLSRFDGPVAGGR